MSTLLLLLLLLATCTSDRMKCPKDCSCSKIDEYSRRYICTAVPLAVVAKHITDGDNVTELWTSTTFSRLGRSELDPIRNKDMIVIKLINGGIDDVEIGSFKSISAKISFLDLTNNKIRAIRKGMLDGLEPIVVLSFLRNYVTDIDVGAFENLRKLETISLGYNKLTTLKAGILRGLSNLKNLEIHDNSISTVEPRALEGLHNLAVLVLAGNKLASFDGEVFQGLSKLQLLNLDHNVLTKVTVGMFPRLESLSDLYVSVNRIKDIEDDAFALLGNLQSLNLLRNRLQKLNPNTLMGLKKLKNLNIGENPMKQLVPYAFRDQRELSYIYLSDVGLEIFPKDILTIMSNITSIWLANNNLTTVDVDFLLGLQNLKQVVIHGNPLHCDCKLKKLWKKYIRNAPDFIMREKHYVPQSPMDPTCLTPPEFKGKAWDIVNELMCD